LLPFAEFSYNNSLHSSIGTSPFFANFGFHPKCDFLSDAFNSDSSNVPAAVSHLSKLRDVHSALDSLLRQASDRAKVFADRHRLEHSFKVGDSVWLLRRNIKTTRPCDKLDARKLGPFKIVEQVNPVAFRLALPASMRIHPVFHVSLLQPHHANSIAGRVEPPPPPVVIDGAEEYEVEEILDSRIRRGVQQYLVKWKGYSQADNTWQSADDVSNSQDLVDAYRARTSSTVGKRGR
jgi:hypothetical protein